MPGFTGLKKGFLVNAGEKKGKPLPPSSARVPKKPEDIAEASAASASIATSTSSHSTATPSKDVGAVCGHRVIASNEGPQTAQVVVKEFDHFSSISLDDGGLMNIKIENGVVSVKQFSP